jgi:hypothetical protein
VSSAGLRRLPVLWNRILLLIMSGIAGFGYPLLAQAEVAETSSAWLL